MKTKRKRKGIALILTLAMALTMMPASAFSEAAPSSIILAGGKQADRSIFGAQKSTIWLGHYPQSKTESVEGLVKDKDYIEVTREDGSTDHFLIEPIKWRVLDNRVDEMGAPFGRLFLLSDRNLDTLWFHCLPDTELEDDKDLTWETSSIRAWLNGYKDTERLHGEIGNDYSAPGDNFKDSAFTPGEQNAIFYSKVRNEDNPQYGSYGGNNTVDQIFLLTKEDTQNGAYGFSDDDSRVSRNTAYTDIGGKIHDAPGRYSHMGEIECEYWWTRTPGEISKEGKKRFVVIFRNGGFIDSGWPHSIIVTVRPAMDINFSSMTLISAPDGKGEKVSQDSLTIPGGNDSDEWKLTVKDDAHKEFTVDDVTTCDGEILNVKYSGAQAGKNEYISAVVTDEYQRIRYYGKLALSSDKTGAKARLDVRGKMEQNDTLYIINEQCNKEHETDFSSPLRIVSVPQGIKHDMKDATCTQPKTCADCGHKEGDALGHKYGDWAKLDETQHQRVCEHDASHIEKEDHSWDEGKVTKEPTCTENGEKTFTCQCETCDAEKKEAVDPLGHDYGDWEVTKKPTALNKGEEQRVCRHDPAHIEKKAIPATGVSGTALSKMKAKGKKSLVISWSKIKGAEGYDIFFARCGKTSKYKKVKTIKGNKTLSWTRTGLKKKKPYKAYVRAWAMKDGKKKYVSKTPSVHTYTTGSTKNYTPARAVSVSKTKVTLKKGKTFRIKAKIKKVNKNKKLMPTDHAPKLRYVTSDSKVAAVSKSGRITAKGKGNCNVYVFAHNGVSKSIKVVVK